MFFAKKGILFLCVMCAVLLLGGCGGSTRDYEGEIGRLKQENVALDAENQQLREEVERLRLTRLASWSLEARGSSQEEPATISFSARPVIHEEDQKAELLILLDGLQTLRVPCVWDGEDFTANLTLTPADGYGYYCILSAPDGTVEQITLSTPEEPRMPKLTFLWSSLSCYASAVLKRIRLDRNRLMVDVAAAIQTPLLTQDGEPVTVNRTELQWLLDGEALESSPVEPGKGETEGSFSVDVSGLCLDVPKMGAQSRLELVLCVSLSDGRQLTAPVGSWTMNDRELVGTVG